MTRKADMFTQLVVIGMTVSAAVLLIIGLFPAACASVGQFVLAPFQLGDPDRSPTGNYLHGGRFAGESDALQDTGGAGRAVGQIGNGWMDQSTWSSADVRYAIDTKVVHGPHPSQRITLRKTGPNGQFTIAQQRVLPIGVYKTSLWLKADRDMPVLVSLSTASENYMTKIMVGRRWTRVILRGPVDVWGNAQFSISSSRPGTLWLADATLYRTSDGYALAVAVALAAVAAALIGAAYARRATRAAGPGSVTVRIGERWEERPKSGAGREKRT